MDGVGDDCDNCPDVFNPGQEDDDEDDIGDVCDECTDTDNDGFGNPGFAQNTCELDNCPFDYNPDQTDLNENGIGDVCEGCCVGRVGDANGLGGDEPTISDISVMIDAKFIAGVCIVDEGLPTEVRFIACLDEADVNLSATGETTCDDITIGDMSILIDYLFITGPETYGPLPDCP